MTTQAVRVGIVGCGDIAAHYLRNAPLFKNLDYVACASRGMASAHALAEVYGLEPLTVDMLLAREDIDVVLNLTNPTAHAETVIAAVEAGKHVFVEKPLAAELSDARRMQSAAARCGRRVGVAPDTIFGAALEVARDAMDCGRIGRRLFGTASAISRGPEHRHPNPAFLYRYGGGPVHDMAVYTIATLTTLLGSIAHVSAVGTTPSATRTSNAAASRAGQIVAVEVLTSVQALLQFESGVQITLTTSWDGWPSAQPAIELHGADGALRLPDPNWFGGPVQIIDAHGITSITTDTMPTGRTNRELSSGEWVADYRGIGLAEMAQAIIDDRPHCCSVENALHCLEVMEAIIISANRRAACIAIESRHERIGTLSVSVGSLISPPLQDRHIAGRAAPALP